MLEGQTATYNICCFEKNQLDLVADIATTAQVSDPTSSHPKETAVSWIDDRHTLEAAGALRHFKSQHVLSFENGLLVLALLWSIHPLGITMKLTTSYFSVPLRFSKLLGCYQ